MPLIVFLRYAHEGLCIPIIPNQAYNGVPEPRTCKVCTNNIYSFACTNSIL